MRYCVRNYQDISQVSNQLVASSLHATHRHNDEIENALISKRRTPVVNRYKFSTSFA